MTEKNSYNVELKRSGLKVTPLRLSLLEFISESEFPIDAQHCCEYLVKKNIPFDQATVYRNLETFVQKNLIKKVDLQGGKYFFEKVSDCSHLICESCGKIEHIHIEKSHEISHEIVEKSGFQINQHVSDFFGTCVGCQKTERRQ